MFRLIFAAALVAAAASPGAAAASAEDDALIGFWAHETTIPNGPQGDLVIQGAAAQWRAMIGAAEAVFDGRGSELRFSFATGGAFRGRLNKRGAIEGFWIQPAFEGERSFATPTALAASGPDLWRGIVRPLPDTIRLYLKIYRNAAGKLVGAFRNPEYNSNGGASLFDVVRNSDAVRFQVKADGSPEIAIDARLRGPDRLEMEWPDSGQSIVFARRAAEGAVGFFPRPPGELRYVYRAPASANDGWITARAREVGMDEGALERLVQRLIDLDPAVRAAPLVHSVLVARRGRLVLDEYFFGFDRETPHDTRSAAKTFSSVMLGALMREGTKITPESKIVDLMAGLGPFANPDARKARITLAHLMTHSAGLACDDNEDASPGNEATLWRQKREPNWWKYTLDLPMAFEPGAHYAYCSANINLVGGALTTRGTWLPALFDRTVARPLQFERYHWLLSPSGEGYLGGGAYLRPRDLLKLGQTYLNGGAWNGQRIVDRAWVEQSTTPRIEISPATTGVKEEEFGNRFIKASDGFVADGYAWHRANILSGSRVYRSYNASGNGGQLLFVVPELQLAVVLTGGNYRQGGIWNRWRDEIVGGEVIAAIR